MIVDIKTAKQIVQVARIAKYNSDQLNWSNKDNEIYHLNLLADRVLMPFIECCDLLGTTLMGDHPARVNIDDMFVPFINTAFKEVKKL